MGLVGVGLLYLFLFTVSCLFSWPTEVEWVSLACYGCQGLTQQHQSKSRRWEGRQLDMEA